jgi:arginyl-tRNA synthetase
MNPLYSGPPEDSVERLEDDIERALRAILRERYGEVPERIVVEHPPRPGMGDFASPVAFELARRLRKPPRVIAQEIASAFPPLPGIARVEAGGAGYLNVFADRAAAVASLARALAAPAPPPSGEKLIVEHTNINPNKAAHIGHLRNAVLGDTLSRCLRFLGRRVEVQNYIDDTGVQVADLVIGFRTILRAGIERARGVEERFDFFCWDLYAKVTEMYATDPARLDLRPVMLQRLEEGEHDDARLAAYLTDRIVRCHLDTMERIGVRYDLLPRESDIIHHRFWEAAFDLLKRRRAITYVTEGERRGCWVMALEGSRFADLKEAEKIIVRSNGTVTYVGKDIAYQLWKFGLLPRDFAYVEFRRYPDGGVAWSTTHAAGAAGGPVAREARFGGAEQVYNVIDVRQAYLQAIVVEGLKALGHPAEAERSVHFSYEMVALTPSSAEAMGVTLSEEDRFRPYVEMSGRRGLGIKADDLLDALEREALREVAERNADLAPDERARLAREISVGALRYFMLKYSRNKVLAFDFKEALSFEGESGPYLQYAAVRASGILDKLAAGGGPAEEEAAGMALEGGFDLPGGEAAEEHWELLLQIARYPDSVTQAVGTLELSQIAKSAFALAQRFNSFYHKYPVIKEPDPRFRRARVVLIHLFRARMRQALDLMGIPIPARM